MNYAVAYKKHCLKDFINSEKTRGKSELKCDYCCINDILGAVCRTAHKC